MSRLLGDQASGEGRLRGQSGKQSSGPWWSGSVSYLSGMWVMISSVKARHVLCRSSWGTVIEPHKTGWLEHQTRVVSQLWGPEMSQVKVFTGFVSSEAPLLGLQAALVLLYLHVTFPACVSVSKTPLSIRTLLRC